MTGIIVYIKYRIRCVTRDVMAAACMAGAFALLGIVKAIPFYIGWSYSGGLAQRWFILLSCGLFATISLCVCFPCIRNMAIFTRGRIEIALLASFFAVSFFVWGISDEVSILFLRNLLMFLGLGMPAFFAGLVTGRYNGIRHFLLALEGLSLSVFPAAVIYLYSYIIVENQQSGIGTINYMTLAYMLMPFMLAHIIDFVYEKARTRVLRNTNFIVMQISRLIAVVVYGVAIVLSGTRGAMLSVLVGIFSLFIINFIYRKKMYKTTLMTIIVLCIFVVGTFGCSTFMKAKMATTFDGLRQGKIVTSTGDHLTDSQIDEMVNSDAVAIQVLHNRGSIYKVAIKEFLKKPIWGMNPGGFQRKYGDGLYPHNIWLEVLCETGIIGFLVFSAVFFVSMRNIITKMNEGNENLGIIAFFSAYLFYAMISDSIWFNWYIMAIIGYGLGIEFGSVSPT